MEFLAKERNEICIILVVLLLVRVIENFQIEDADENGDEWSDKLDWNFSRNSAF